MPAPFCHFLAPGLVQLGPSAEEVYPPISIFKSFHCPLMILNLRENGRLALALWDHLKFLATGRFWESREFKGQSLAVSPHITSKDPIQKLCKSVQTMLTQRDQLSVSILIRQLPIWNKAHQTQD